MAIYCHIYGKAKKNVLWKRHVIETLLTLWATFWFSCLWWQCFDPYTKRLLLVDASDRRHVVQARQLIHSLGKHTLHHIGLAVNHSTQWRWKLSGLSKLAQSHNIYIWKAAIGSLALVVKDKPCTVCFAGARVVSAWSHMLYTGSQCCRVLTGVTLSGPAV